MPRPLPTRLLSIALYILLGLLGLYAFSRWLLPWLWPFLLAWAAAAVMEPAVARLCRQGLPRGVAAGICSLAFFTALLALLWLLGTRVLGEVGELLPRLPALLGSLTATLRRWQAVADGLAARAPEGVAALLDGAVAGLTDSLSRLPGALTGRVLGAVSGFAAAAPSVLLFSVTAVIGSYFISACYPSLLHSAARLLPDRFLCRARLLRRDLRRTLGRWLKAQGLMSLIICGVLAAAFLLLGVRYALLLALLTALVDALPVLGAGTVLLPWALYELLTGKVPLALGLAVTYAAVTVLRSAIQAKLLGDQLGLHPLATLAAIYAGWTLWGVMGMVVFPILAICVKQALPGLEQYRERRPRRYEGGNL
ncbi:MAG: sporulation integral membrane protein YtvI [Oscillospiraceae bacterium]|nr:sporulation integral membrane protein YtvI [Oscillospiraceae bacterium]